MIRPLRVSAPPSKPLLVFDGDCNFCRRAVGRLRQVAGGRLDSCLFKIHKLPSVFLSCLGRFSSVRCSSLSRMVSVHAAAEAIFRSVAAEKPWLLWLYRNAPAFAPISEGVYRVVAEHRTIFSMVSRWLWGESFERPSYVWVRWVFLRLLAFTYLIAFVSLWTQIHGLAGQNGILPAERIMDAAREQTAASGLDRFRLVPTFGWIGAGDTSLTLHCAAGAGLAILLAVGVAPAFSLAFLWLLYLSLVTVCPVFLAFQWDNLLLEVGLLAIFFAPLNLRPGVRGETPLSTLMLWLLRWLLFRLMFASGAVKLLSGDSTWRSLDALNFHYETQPLPTWISWYMHHLPEWCQKGSMLLMFGIELVVPFLIFLPRRARLLAFWPLLGLQIIIALTGNYGFFNLLTVALCLLLLDDKLLLRAVPARWRESLARAGAGVVWPTIGNSSAPWRRLRTCHGGLLAGIAILLLLLSFVPLFGMFRFRSPWMSPVVNFYTWASPLRSVNGYGLFAVMTTSRPEIIVQGSNDAEKWLDYEFKWKPGKVRQKPGFVAPHMPRLDWQMWFAALGTYRQNPWFINFCVRLLQGSPEVIALLKRNPFPEAPPRHVRAILYQYHFTTQAQRRAERAWWQREIEGE